MTPPHNDSCDRRGRWIDDADADVPLDHAGEYDDLPGASEVLMDSLLQQHFEDPDVTEDRIQGVLKRFDETQAATPAERTSIAAELQIDRQRRRVVTTISAVAVVMVCCGFWMLPTTPSAEAAVDRALQTLRDPVTRLYEGVVRTRVLGRETVRAGKLYSQSTSRSVAVLEDRRWQPLVIGANEKHRWLVAGSRTWTSDSSEELPKDVLISRVTLRHVQFNSLLTSIPRKYSVRYLATEPLPGDETVTCRPIEATLKNPDERFPRTIRMWLHPQTGVVTQVHVLRNEGGRLASRRIEIRLVGESDVPPDFFDAQYHDGRRSDQPL